MWQWEGLKMGHAVITRLAPEAVAAYREIGDGTAPPILSASNIDMVAATLRSLRSNTDLLIAIGEEGKAWMNRHYADEKIARLYIKEYES
jgi:hypothetical protein